jgi:small redox-active disulfide protein 2
MLDIKVLGPGCYNCNKVEATAKQAAANLGIDAQFEKVTDRAEYPKYGLLYTPGLVVNGKLVCGGRIPSEAEVMTWLADALN